MTCTLPQIRESPTHVLKIFFVMTPKRESTNIYQDSNDLQLPFYSYARLEIYTHTYIYRYIDIPENTSILQIVCMHAF